MDLPRCAAEGGCGRHRFFREREASCLAILLGEDPVDRGSGRSGISRGPSLRSAAAPVTGAMAGLDPDTWDTPLRERAPASSNNRGRTSRPGYLCWICLCFCLFISSRPLFLFPFGLRGRWEAAMPPNAPRTFDREVGPTRKHQTVMMHSWPVNLIRNKERHGYARRCIVAKV